MKKGLLLFIGFVCMLITFHGNSYAQSATCTGATSVSVDGSSCPSNQNVTDATFETSANNTNICGSGVNVTKEAWYSFQATATTASVGWQSGRAPAVQVFSGGCASLTQIGCSNNVAGSSVQTEIVDLTGLTIGNTYYVRITNTTNNTISGANAGTLCVTSSTFAMDCNQAHPVCSDVSFSSNSPGYETQELNASNTGCLNTNEHQTTWFGFSPQLTGTIQLTISPTAGSVDYDFAIWGPYGTATCPVTGAPLRCSYSSSPVPTGLFAGAGDNTEGAGGDAHVNPLTITAADLGKVFYLVVDNYATNATPFTLSWTFSTPNMLDCTPPLPVELGTFTGTTEDKINVLNWATQAEINNDYFIVEKSNDANNYNELGRVKGHGNSNIDQYYQFNDPTPYQTTYYRLTQVDFNGVSKTYPPVSIKNDNISGFTVYPLYPNPADQSFFIDIFAKDVKDVQITVINSMGQTVYSKPTTIEGLNKVEITSDAWSPGIYIVKVENEAEHYQSVQRVLVR